MLAVLGVAMIAFAGCGNDAPGAQPSPSSSVDARAASRAGWLEVASCMRANGYPNFPDPVENERGVWEFPSASDEAAVPPQETTTPCDDLVRNAKQATEAANAPSAEEMAKLRQYASCMREHGAPNFPDPDSEGFFDLPPELKDDPARGTAHEACLQYAPPPRPK